VSAGSGAARLTAKKDYNPEKRKNHPDSTRCCYELPRAGSIHRLLLATAGYQTAAGWKRATEGI